MAKEWRKWLTLKDAFESFNSSFEKDSKEIWIKKCKEISYECCIKERSITCCTDRSIRDKHYYRLAKQLQQHCICCATAEAKIEKQ